MVHAIDLDFLHRPHAIAAGLIAGPHSAVLVDPGPTSSVPALRAGLASHGLTLDDVEAVLLTHVHLDHAGAAGSLAREQPGLQVYVHERGARHVIDPSRLLSSARTLYGNEMGRLWGEVPPTAAERVTVLKGGERIPVAGRTIDVAYTPGHASHHVSYLDSLTGTAFVGDTAGIRVPGSQQVIPPTPPPDIDLEAWGRSVELLREWAPSQLFLTHFGPFDDAATHLDRFEAQLSQMAGWVRDTLLEAVEDDAERMAHFRSRMVEAMRDALPDPGEASAYDLPVSSDHCWMGLARYWRRRGVY